MKPWPNKSLQATPDGGFSSASRFIRFGPACLSSGLEDTMPIFGRSKREFDGGLLELAEATFEVSAADLRRVAQFLNECADGIESGDWRTSHRHLTEADRTWGQNHPSSDIIVLHTSPNPPKVVA